MWTQLQHTITSSLLDWYNTIHLQPMKTIDLINLFLKANADAQHHDGVTGTSEPDVVTWFEEGLRGGITAGLQVL